MAEVFEAELLGDLGFVRKVAVKRMLEASAADLVAARRFLDEAVIASQLHHANIISVIDLGLLDDRPFQVLEYVDGLDAGQLLHRAGGTLPLEVAIAIATSVAHALDHAHGACDASGVPLGIVHRDVKPSNVLVSWSGDAKLGDFGIAFARDREATTEAGVVAGTAGFIAPEQRARLALDGSTDVFALGLTIHALLTGDSPLADIEIEMRVLAGDPVPIDPTLPGEVRELLASALALNRGERPTAAELAARLGAILAPCLHGDSRTMLRDFLTPFSARPAPARGALDALLGIEVVRTDGSTEEVPRFVTRGASPPSKVTPPLRIKAQNPVPREASTRPTVERVSGTRRGVVALALVAAVGVGGSAIYRLAGSSTPTDTLVELAADASIVSQIDAAGADALAVDAVVITMHASARDAGIGAAPDAAAVRDAAVVTPRDGAGVPRDAPLDAALGIGYLQVLGEIAGEDVIGASVIVDGRTVGSIPNVFAVPFGMHTVAIERRDGRRLSARTVEVTPVHNRANPLRPTW